MTGQPLKQEDDRINESPLVRVLQRHFRRLDTGVCNRLSIADKKYEPSVEKVIDIEDFKTVEHAPTALSNPFWNSNGVKEQEER